MVLKAPQAKAAADHKLKQVRIGPATGGRMTDSLYLLVWFFAFSGVLHRQRLSVGEELQQRRSGLKPIVITAFEPVPMLSLKSDMRTFEMHPFKIILKTFEFTW